MAMDQVVIVLSGASWKDGNALDRLAGFNEIQLTDRNRIPQILERSRVGSMRVAVAGLHTETNTFSPIEADLARFGAVGVFRGDEMVSEFSTSLNTVAGFLQACREQRAEVVPLLYANAWACGTITAEAFESLSDELLKGVADRGPFDVVLLAQHGAAVSEQHLDVDGELAARVRAVVGPDVVVAMGLDLHGNISERLIDAVDIAVGYRENPHRDPVVRGAECAGFAFRCARGEARPVQHLVRLPMVVPILGGWTGEGPMREIMSDAEQIAASHSLRSYTVFHGFGYADVPQMGSSVLAVTDGEPELAKQAARKIAGTLWRKRDSLLGEAMTPASAVAEAAKRASADGPIVLLDVGDNIGGGSPGDSTVLLSEALAQRVRGFVTAICDEGAVRHGLAAGFGTEVELSLGRTTPVSVGPRLRIMGRVTQITDGRFEDSNQTHGGFRVFDGGPTVRLTTPDDQEVVISSRVVPPFSTEQLRAVGIEPREQRVLVAKGVVAPRAGYEAVARDFLLVDTPGVTAAELMQFSYVRRPRPLWPLECEASAGITDETHAC